MLSPLNEDAHDAERARLEALASYGVLDTPPEEAFDEITRLAAHLCDAPIALVTLIDETRQWFKSSFGVEATEKPRATGFCQHTLDGEDVLIVPDALSDDRFAASPLVTSEPHVRFYAGFPLRSEDGFGLGTLCVMDREPRELSAAQTSALATLARQVVTQLELRRKLSELEHAQSDNEHLDRSWREAGHHSAVPMKWIAPDGTILWANRAELELLEREESEVVGENVMAFLADPSSCEDALSRCARGEPLNNYEARIVTPDGVHRDVLISSSPMFRDEELVRTHCFTVDVTEKRRVDDAMVALAGLGSTGPDDDFFRDLVRRLAEALDVEVAYIAERKDPDVEKLSLLALWQGGDHAACFDYPLSGTPCEKVLSGTGAGAFYPRDVRATFPDDAWLAEARLESYRGIPLRDSHGVAMGLLGVADTEPMPESLSSRHILKVFADRAASELVRSRAERAVRGQEQALRLVAEQTPTGLFQTDVDGRCLFVNATWCEIAGISPDEALGDGWVRVLHPDDRERVRQEWYGAASRLEPFVSEYRFRRPDGTEIWLTGRATPLYSDEGKHSGYLGAVTDISERKRWEIELQASEERYRLLAVHATDMISKHDLEGRYVFASPASKTLLGYEPEEMFGHSAYDFFHPDDVERITKTHETILESAESASVQFRLRRKDGSYVSVESSVKTIRDEMTGAPKEIIAGTRDVTERAQLEEELRHAQKMEAVGRLAGGIAHDFNNLLMIIEANNEFLRETDVGAASRMRHTEEIGKAARRAGKLTSQLLAYSRRQLVEPATLDAGRLLDDISDMLRRLLGERIDLVTRDLAARSTIRVDRSQFEQVIMNLAINARDAMRDGGRLTFEIRNAVFERGDDRVPPGMRPGSYVLVEVADDGEGMASGTLERCFEPFFTTKQAGEGTGLGLATVYGIVKQNDGFVYARSEPGRGTTFQLYFPEAKGDADFETRRFEERVASGSGTILLVEDEPSIRGVLCDFLGVQGYEVLAAASRAEAIEILEQHSDPIDFLLSDVVLPDANGFELAGQIAERLPAVRVVYMSGYAPDLAERRRGGAFLQKPFSMGQLTQALQMAAQARDPG